MHLALSFIGLAVLVTLVFSPSSVQSSVPWSKPLLGLVFGLICVSGIAAGLFPARCSETLFTKEKTRTSHASKHAASGFLGHHPACGSFGAHVFRLKEKVYCAGCVGLILGGLFSIFGVVFYFFLGTIQCLDWLVLQVHPRDCFNIIYSTWEKHLFIYLSIPSLWSGSF